MLLVAAALASAPPPVVGGSPSPEGEWLDAAAVYWGNQMTCTGVLIAPNLALTAGHCAGNISKIEIGTNDYTDVGETIEVREEHEYPNSERSYDVTLLVLEEDAITPPRDLALDCVLDEYLYDGATVEIVGYGAINEQGTRYPTQLYQAETVVTGADCSERSTGCISAVSPGGELAAGGDGVDSCYGDSGGPLYLKVEDEWYLVGITSRGVSASDWDCGHGGIYVRPDAVAEWIEETSGVTLERPDCSPNVAPAPTADDIEVPDGESATVTVSPNDPDDTHTFSITGEPAMGSATLDGPDLTYAATGGTGETTVTITVTDSEGASGSVTVDVRVKTAPIEGGDDTGDGGTEFSKELPGCGCAAPVPPAILALLPALLAVRRRR